MRYYTKNILKHYALGTSKFNSTSYTILNPRKNKKIDLPMVNEETTSHNESQLRKIFLQYIQIILEYSMWLVVWSAIVGMCMKLHVIVDIPK